MTSVENPFIDKPIRIEPRGDGFDLPTKSPGHREELTRTLHVDRLVTVGFLASQCNHEARNKLEVIRAALELLARGMEDALTPADRAFLLKEADDYITELELHLDLARTGSGPVQRMPIRMVVDDTLLALKAVMLRSNTNVSSRVIDDAIVHGSRRLLRQVLINIFRNALDSMYGCPQPRIVVRSGVHGGCVRLNIEDNGPGVDRAERSRLFDAFATTKPNGTGLGLAICRRIIGDMNGRIEFVAPKMLSGANVQIELPLAEETGSAVGPRCAATSIVEPCSETPAGTAAGA